MVTKHMDAAMDNQQNYLALIDRLIKSNPNGFECRSDVKLSRSDSADVVAYETDIIGDALANPSRETRRQVVEAYATRDYATLGAVLAGALDSEAKEYVYLDIDAHLLKRDEEAASNDARTSREIAAWDAGVPAFGEL